MGLGSLRAVSLKRAREQAERCRASVQDCKGPIRLRDKSRRAQEYSDISLKNIARQAFEAKKAELKGEVGRFCSPRL